MGQRTACQVVVVGGGIAGAWLAYRLAQRDVHTVLISADDDLPAVSRRWALGLVRRDLLDGASGMLADCSSSRRPGYSAMIEGHLTDEYAELTRMIEYTPFNVYLKPDEQDSAPRLGRGDQVVAAVLARYEELGGITIRGRVTDLVVDDGTCLGLRYQCDGVAGTVSSRDVVLASGGFCGLFADGVGTNPGHLLGTYARRGGALANLEMFSRYPLGDLDRKLPCYPFDFDGPPQLSRAGEPATALQHALDASRGDQQDLDVFRNYWIHHLGTPHSVETAAGSHRLGPIRAFSMGGAAASGLRNVHAVGECAHGLVVDSVSGKPFLTSMAEGRVLADRLAEHSGGVATATFDCGRVQPGMDSLLRKEIESGLDAFADNRFTVELAERFAQWCRTRRRENSDLADIDLLVLAEAYTRSVLARRESRGFFFRPDFPDTDSTFDNTYTLARYDPDADRVDVELRHRETSVTT